MQLSQIRYQQQYQQIQQRMSAGSSDVISYSTRDPITGLRIVSSADGGQQYARYLSNAQPDGILSLSQSAPIGLPGYISQKPH
jgi:hypothetical protein